MLIMLSIDMLICVSEILFVLICLADFTHNNYASLLISNFTLILGIAFKLQELAYNNLQIKQILRLKCPN